MKKPVALILALVLVSSFMIFAQAQERPLTMEASVSGIALSGDYLGAYDEVGVATGLSGRLTVEDAIALRALVARGPERTSENYWTKFEQTDTISQFSVYPEFDLEKGWELRAPGLIVGQKQVKTVITEKWWNRTDVERRSQGFTGIGAELGFEKDHFNSYLGLQEVWHESCGNSTTDTLVFAGFGYEF